MNEVYIFLTIWAALVLPIAVLSKKWVTPKAETADEVAWTPIWPVVLIL